MSRFLYAPGRDVFLSGLSAVCSQLRGKALLIVTASIAAMTAGTLLAYWLPGLPGDLQGLRVTRYDGTGQAAVIVAQGVDRSISTVAIHERVGRNPIQSFALAWNGFLTVEEAGPQCFWTLSDDGSWIWIDDTLVVDNGGAHGPRRAKGCVELPRGLHTFRVRYTQEGGGVLLQALWRQASGRFVHLDMEPAELLVRRVRWSTYRFLRLRTVLLQATVVLWTAALGAFVVGLLSWLVARAAVRDLPEDARPTLRMVLVLTVGLMVWGLNWGMPAFSGWAPDEVEPSGVMRAVSQVFANGWYDLYPPLQFMLLGLPAMPLQLMEGSQFFQGDPLVGVTALHVVMRLVTVAMATGLVAVLYRLGLETIGRSGAAFACLLFISSPTVIYYSKTANVDMPYVFWVGLSLLFYSRVIAANRLADYLALAATATAAVCTKDQAYGFYVLVPVVLIVSNAIHRRRAGERLRFMAVILDRKFVLSMLLAAALFAAFHNLLFNLSGFRSHLQRLREGIYPPMVEPTLGGTWQFLGLNLRLLAWLAGWPGFILAAIGLVTVLFDVRKHVVLVSLLVPVASYALFFVDVVRYSYDRFLLGPWFVLALFGGKAAADLLQAPGRWRAWRVAALTGALSYSLLYGASVNAAMTRDARYRAEQYLRDEAEKLSSVGTFGFPKYLPRQQRGFRWQDLDPTIGFFCAARPEYVVFNALWAQRLNESEDGQSLMTALDDGTLGYRAVMRYRTPFPFWAVMRWWDIVPEGPESGLTFFSKINPTTVVLERRSGEEPVACREPARRDTGSR